MTVGRPLNIPTVEDFEARADAYLSEREQSGAPVTITGLALAVGLASRKSLLEYEDKPEFSNAVKRAKARVEAAYEGRLWAQAPAGAIFALKNLGWSDKQEIAHSGGVSIQATPVDEAL